MDSQLCGYHYVYCHSLGDDIKNQHIPFSLSVEPLQLREGDTSVAVKSCSPEILIGNFYMCYSKNLSDLEKLEVDAQHCCYCSREASEDCMKIFPNWNLTDAGSSVYKCYLSLLTVNETDTGYYQCRLSLVESNNDYRNCMLRYGDITEVSVSNPHPSPNPNSTPSHIPSPSPSLSPSLSPSPSPTSPIPTAADHSNIGDWIHTHDVAIIIGIIISVVVVAAIVITLTTYRIYKRKKNKRHRSECIHA